MKLLEPTLIFLAFALILAILALRINYLIVVGRIALDVKSIMHTRSELIELLKLVKYLEPKTFDQKLDHFEPENRSRWPQRYWTNDRHFNGSGPVLLYIGGDEEQSGLVTTYDTLITQLAGEVGALVVGLEHRYFGESRPTPDTSTPNLRFLSFDQAVADLVNFREFIHSGFNLTAKNKWLAMGRGYGGELAARLRVQHPEHFHAALASSAGLDYHLEDAGLVSKVNSIIKTYNPHCALALSQAITSLKSELANTIGRCYLSNLFKHFGDLTDDRGVHALTDSILSVWIQAALNLTETSPRLETLCGRMLSTSIGSELDRLANATLTIITSSQFASNSDKHSWQSVAQMKYKRIRLHQRCFEFGRFPTSRPTDLPLGIDASLDSYMRLCGSEFDDFSPNRFASFLNKHMIMFGGSSYPRGTRVVFVSCERDQRAGLVKTAPNNETKLVRIAASSYCNDFKGHQSDQPAEHNEAVAAIKLHLKAYLRD